MRTQEDHNQAENLAVEAEADCRQHAVWFHRVEGVIGPALGVSGLFASHLVADRERGVAVVCAIGQNGAVRMDAAEFVRQAKSGRLPVGSDALREICEATA